MLENKKIAKNIIVILMAIIVILGIYIKVRQSQTERIEIDTIATEDFGHVKNSITVASIELDKRNNKSNLQAEMAKSIKFNRYSQQKINSNSKRLSL